MSSHVQRWARVALAVLVVLAGVAALIQAGPTAAAGERTVSQYYFYVPPRDGTSVSSMAKAGAVILTNDKYREQLRDAGFDGEAWQYITANEIEGPGPYSNSSSGCDTNYQAFGNNVGHTKGDFCRHVHKNESWFLHNGKGQRLYQRSNGRVYYHMNPASSGWRQFAAGRMREQLTSRGYDGIYLDNVELSRYKALHQLPNSDGTLKEFSSDTAFRSAWVNYLAHLSSQLRPRGKLIGNMIADWNDGSTWNAYLQYLDGGMYEAFAAGYVGEPWKVSKWENHLTQAEWALANGKTVLAVAQGFKSDYSRQAFTLASYLLITDGQRAHFRYGHFNDYAAWWQYSNYNVELGQPTGKRYQQSDGTWKRDFECGSVVVNPNRSTGTITESSCTNNPPPPAPVVEPPSTPAPEPTPEPVMQIEPVALPGKIEAENYKVGGFSDTTSGNIGEEYRNDDVDIQTTNDSGGGYNVGWVEPGESLTYAVSVAAAGNYEFALRVASPQHGKKVYLEINGQNVTGSISLPATGGYQQWTDMTSEPVHIDAGNHTVKVVAETDGFNLNYVEVKTASVEESAPLPEIDKPDLVPDLGVAALPGKVEAEDYAAGGQDVAYSDSSRGNNGGELRNDDVDIQVTTDIGGGHNVGWTSNGEWLNYDVDIASAGNYAFTFRLSSTQRGNSLRLELDGANLTGSVAVPFTGGQQNWVDVTTNAVALPTGKHQLRVVVERGGFNFNHFTAALSSDVPPVDLPSDGIPTESQASILIQAEDFKEGGPGIGYHDTTPGNIAGKYRSGDVDIQVTEDQGGGHNVAWIDAGEWLAYDIVVPEDGSYSFTIRVASTKTGKSLNLELGGSDVTGTLAVPTTGAWQRWADITTEPIELAAGNHVLRLVADTDGFNVNYIRMDSR